MHSQDVVFVEAEIFILYEMDLAVDYQCTDDQTDWNDKLRGNKNISKVQSFSILDENPSKDFNGIECRKEKRGVTAWDHAHYESYPDHP